MIAGLPYRGEFGAARPAPLAGLAPPPAPMPARLRLRPLKAWRPGLELAEGYGVMEEHDAHW